MMSWRSRPIVLGRAAQAARGTSALSRQARHIIPGASSASFSASSTSRTTRRNDNSVHAAGVMKSRTGFESRGPPPASPIYSRSPPVSGSSPSPSTAFSPTQDDTIIKYFFDSLSPAYASPQGSNGGLFQLEPLTAPHSLSHLTDRTLVHGQAIVDRICNSVSDPTGKELRLVVKNLDRLSDLLCGVIDMCELVRNVHPDTAWLDACDEAYERLCSFMNGLNTDRGLFQVS
jgi:intermediate peptidase